MPAKRRSSSFRCHCSWRTFPHSKPRHCDQDAARRAGLQPDLGHTGLTLDYPRRRCQDCGVPFITSHRRSLECPECGVTIAKTSKSASALYDRDEHIFLGTHAQWKEWKKEQELCTVCHAEQWENGMTEMCVGCGKKKLEEMKSIEWLRGIAEWRDDTADFRQWKQEIQWLMLQKDPVHNELLCRFQYDSPILHPAIYSTSNSQAYHAHCAWVNADYAYEPQEHPLTSLSHLNQHPLLLNRSPSPQPSPTSMAREFVSPFKSLEARLT